MSDKKRESEPQTVRIVRSGEADEVNCDLVPEFKLRLRRFRQS